MRSLFQRGDERTVGLVTVTGMLLPFLAAFALIRVVDEKSLLGPANNAVALTLGVRARAGCDQHSDDFQDHAESGNHAHVVRAHRVRGSRLSKTPSCTSSSASPWALAATQGAEARIFGMPPTTPESITVHLLATLVLFGVMLRLGSAAFRRVARMKSESSLFAVRAAVGEDRLRGSHAFR